MVPTEHKECNLGAPLGIFPVYWRSLLVFFLNVRIRKEGGGLKAPVGRLQELGQPRGLCTGGCRG